MVVLAFLALLIALGTHIRLARWGWSLGAPVLAFMIWVFLRLSGQEDYDVMWFPIVVLFGLPAVLFGALTGALMAVSIRAEYLDVRPDHWLRP
jgi:hypothetical protein